MFVRDMKRDTHHSNDNEPISFSQIGLAAALVLNKLRVKAQLETTERDEDEQREGSRATAEEDRKQTHEQYVQERLAKFREFERRANNLLRR